METALWLFFFFVPCFVNVGVFGKPQSPYSEQAINNGVPRGPGEPPYGRPPNGGSTQYIGNSPQVSQPVSYVPAQPVQPYYNVQRQPYNNVQGQPYNYPGTDSNNAISDSTSTNNINVGSGNSGPDSLLSLFNF